MRTLVTLISLSFIIGSGLFVKLAYGKSATEVAYPDGYRRWSHVKSMVIFDKNHKLYEAFGGIHHIYANKKAYKGLNNTKKRFPKGSTFVFDLLAHEEADGTYSEGDRKFIGVMTYDRKKHKSTGGWGFQVFEGDGKEAKLTTMKEQKTCFSCHVEMKKSRYVYSKWRK